MPTFDSNRNPLTESSIVLAGITGILYCSSYAYYNGFLRTLLLDPNVLDRNFQQILYDGFLKIASLEIVVLLIIIYPFFRFLYSHLVLPSINSYLRRSISKKREYVRLKRYWLGKKKDSAIELREKKKTIKIVSCCAAFIVFIATLAYFESSGKREANRILEEITLNQIPSSDFITTQINGEPQKLIYLTCGARNCAGMDLNTKTVYYFPQNGHSFVLSMPRSNSDAAKKS
jgi:hypothetical protein